MTASREASGRRARQPLGERRHARAARIIDLAWADLPTEHRLLLENVGAALLALAPRGVGERIRRAGRRRSQVTHELVADIYALLMSRRRRGETGQPPWLDDRIYRLVRRICTWND